MIDYLKKRPMLLCGICASALCVIAFYSRTAVFFLGLALIFLFFFLILNRVNYVYAFVVFMLVMVSVSVLVTFNRIDTLNKLDATKVKGSFVAIESPVNHGSYYSAVIKACDCERLESGTRVMVFGGDGGFECGDKIVGTVNISKVSGKYRASDYSEKIYLTGYIDNVTVYSGEGSFVLSNVNRLRNYIVDALFSNMDYEEAATLTALTVGDRLYLSEIGRASCRERV